MTTKTTKHEALIDETEQILQNKEYAKVAGLVCQAAFSAIQEAAAKRGINCAENDHILEIAATLDQICTSTMLPYAAALASA